MYWKFTAEDDSGYTLYDFAGVLRSRGWQVPAYSMPNREDLVIQRILVRHGVSRHLASLLDLVKAIQQACLAQGLMLLTCGTHVNVIRWLPPLIVTSEQIDESVAIFASALRTVLTSGS